MAVLYRTHRPQKFGEVVGQEYIIKTLKAAAASGDFAHAYLFCGSRGVGKTSVARIVAKAANCQKLKNGEVCLSCGPCTAIAAGSFMDLVEIDAASNTGVDNIRELIEHVRFQPSSGKYKVFIIDEVHMLSKGAFNALLKTLEEPPKHAIFILATTEIHKVPATIISRTQRFTFGRVTHSDVVTQLSAVAKKENVTISTEALELVARQSEGSLRDALSLLGKVATLGGNIELAEVQTLLGVTTFATSFNLMELIGQKKTSELADFFDSLLDQGTDFTIFNKDFLEHLRLLLVYTASGSISTEVATLDQIEQIKVQSKYASTHGWIHIIRLFLRSLKDAHLAPMPELPMLLASIEASTPTVQAVASVNAQTQKLQPAESDAPAGIAPEPIVKSTMTEQTQETPKEAAVLGSITLSEVETVWVKVIDAVKLQNSPLATLLRNSPLDGVQDGIIMLRVKYLFHKEHVENLKNQTLLSGAIEAILGKKVRVRAVVSKPEGQKTDVVDMVTDALQVFGGELVE